jgi:hypothetical protein
METGMDLTEWIARITAPNEELGKLPVCPFAKGAKYEIIATDGSDIAPPPWDFELLIYKLPDEYTEWEVVEIAQEYNKLYPELVFLPDPKNRHTEINGIQTNNGKYNLILCQWRDALLNARNKLANTPYYSFWNKAYLDEIQSI